ncbi:hypothetical protein SH661x_004546 [Planctomicrobium sp. SH661]|uniref:hypothetical protein n=1 Tax=Planctomicrobium sp. SH661 TaxID=3448124 RepID=UPI003F5C0169
MRTHWKLSFLVLGMTCLSSVAFADDTTKPDQEQPADEVKSEKPEKKPAARKGDHQHRAKPNSAARVNGLFDRLDADKDGSISREEFAKAASKLQGHVQQARHNPHAGRGWGYRGRTHVRTSHQGWHRQTAHRFHRGQFSRFGRDSYPGFHGRTGFRQPPHFAGRGFGYGGGYLHSERHFSGPGPRHFAMHSYRDAGRGGFGQRGGFDRFHGDRFERSFGEHGHHRPWIKQEGERTERHAGPRADQGGRHVEHARLGHRPPQHADRDGKGSPDHPRPGARPEGERHSPPRGEGVGRGPRPEANRPLPEEGGPREPRGDRDGDRRPEFGRGEGGPRPGFGPGRGPRMNRDRQPEKESPKKEKEEGGRQTESSPVEPESPASEITLVPPTVPMPELIASYPAELPSDSE